MMNQVIITASLVVFANFLFAVKGAEITDECLGCICQASSGCNKDQGCSDGGVCGPFLITWGFWSDAGKPVLKGTQPNDPAAYSTCVNDMFCASETVRSYSRIFGKDCTGDGAIDCEDFMRIHKFGPGACNSPTIAENKFFKEFEKCKSIVNPK
ncbi:unnamed protein product [Orchesella dallaii]|uniref:lysozyme n=1 Tax=Orchesella dallaii TaxID=48710 RepID=A0ABP1RX56_9HEXA